MPLLPYLFALVSGDEDSQANTPPAIPILTEPIDAVEVLVGESVSIGATTSDHNLDRVDWVLDPGPGEIIVASDSTEFYSTIWLVTESVGDHVFVVRAWRNGLSTDSVPIAVTIRQLTTPLLLSPSDGLTRFIGESISLSASTTDLDIDHIDFIAVKDGIETVIATDDEGPFLQNWVSGGANLSVGEYTIFARALLRGVAAESDSVVTIFIDDTLQFNTYTANASFTTPNNYTSLLYARNSLYVEGYGSGAGGTTNTGAGGGGACAINPDLITTPNTIYSVVVPAAGAVTANGSDFTFGSTLVVAKGGRNAAGGGLGGKAVNCIGTTCFDGGDGAQGTSTRAGGGGAGNKGSATASTGGAGTGGTASSAFGAVIGAGGGSATASQTAGRRGEGRVGFRIPKVDGYARIHSFTFGRDTASLNSREIEIPPRLDGKPGIKDLLVLYVAPDGYTDVTAEGWHYLVTEKASLITGAVLYRAATGTDPIELVTSGAEELSWVAVRYIDAGPPSANSLSDSSTNAVTPAHAPPESVDKYIGVAMISLDGDTRAEITAAPSGYSEWIEVPPQTTGGATVCVAHDLFETSTIPAASYSSANEQWVGIKVSIPFSMGGVDLPANPDVETNPPPEEVELETGMPGGFTQSGKQLQGLNSRQVQEYYVKKLRTLDEAKSTIIAGLANQAAVEAYQAEKRAQIMESLGPFPDRTPLNAQTKGTLVRSGYKVEKVLFESMPGWFVSANLYVPDAAVLTPAPGILILCGHDDRAKWNYQSYAQGCAKLGYVSLIMDPIGASERKTSFAGTPVSEHKLFGRQIPVVGWSLCGIQAWDASRGIDYLLSRPEVNPNHIGVSGTSGGGTQTVMVGAIDQRITMLAPSCFVTKFRSNLENEIWADHEQMPFDVIGQGLDIDDFLLMMAPKPMVLIGQRFDFFDLRGLEAIHDRMVQYYTLFGVNPATHCELFIDSNGHQLDVDGHEAGYRLFAFASGSGFGTDEPAIVGETEAALQVTVSGSVLDEPGAIDTVGLLTPMVIAAEAIAGSPTGNTLKNHVREVLRMPDYDAEDVNLTDSSLRAVAPHYRYWEFYNPWTNQGTGGPPITPPNYPKPYGIRYGIETEPGIIATAYYNTSGVWSSQIPTVSAGTTAILYVAHISADQELSKTGREKLITDLVAANPTTAFFALDVRGVGESIQTTNATVSALGGSGSGDDFYAEIAESLNESFLGRTVWDVLRTIDLLASYGFTNIYLAGSGNGSVPAALAGLLDSRVTRVYLRHALPRWRACAVADPKEMAWPQSRLPKRVLSKFDLNDIYAELTSIKSVFSSVDTWTAWAGNLTGEV